MKEVKFPKQCPECNKWHFGKKHICNSCLRDKKAIDKVKYSVRLNVFQV